MFVETGGVCDWRTSWYVVSNWVSKCGQGGVRQFVYYTNRPAFLERNGGIGCEWQPVAAAGIFMWGFTELGKI